MTETQQAGWYPADGGVERWWDGAAWTEATRPLSAQPSPAAPSARGEQNVLGIIALVASALGAVFACIPGFFILGWVLLPIGFILGLVGLFLRGKAKWPAVTGLIVSVVGTVVGFAVFFASLSGAVSEAMSDGDTTIVEGGGTTITEPSEAPAPAEEAPSGQGTRTNPLAFGSAIENDDWTIALTGFTRDANGVVADANMFNAEPPAGQQYVIVEASATYGGRDEGLSSTVNIDYVTADGTVISTWDNLVSGIEPVFGQANLYAGASDSGKLVFLVPSSLDGLIRVKPGMFADDLFFALP